MNTGTRLQPSVCVDAEAALRSARRTVQTECDGLSALQKELDSSLSAAFVAAFNRIARARGRLIVTGVGKSGHIGWKLAASFASTGTAATFVHAAEANHGDLGMIGPDDVILAISWSGETAELHGIVSYSRRFSIPLIAMTSRRESTLARAADTVLLLPRAPEACPHGLAPTTSTLMQLSLGDALAVALLEARGFSPEDFRIFHPGGSLGAKLTRVRDVMHAGDRLPLVRVGTSMSEALGVQSQKRFGCVVVIAEDGSLRGIVTDGDLRRNLHRALADLTVDEVMTPHPKTVAPDALCSTALGIIEDHQISALVVIEHDRPVGLIHFQDLLRRGAA